MVRWVLAAVGLMLVCLVNAEEETIVRRTEPISLKLNLLEARLKHFLKRNNSHSDIDKLRKYIFLTTMGIKLDLSKLVQNYSNTSQKHEADLSSLSYVHTKGPDRPRNLYRMCKHIVESDICQQMEYNESKLEITRLLRVADHLINIKTRFTVYSAIYDDMKKKQYDNIFNLNAFLNMLVYHFISNSNTPQGVIEDAKVLRDNIGKTFKQNAVKEVIEHILNYCFSTDIDVVLWQLATVTGAGTNELSNIFEEAINATYALVGPVPLLDRGLKGKIPLGGCLTARAVFQRIKMNGELCDTTIIFKLAQLIAHALNDTYATLDELEPCFEVERQLNPSVREIVIAQYGCIQNQLYKAFIFPVIDGSKHVQKNGMVFVTDSDEESEYSKWRFEINGSNRFRIQNSKTKEYLYMPEAADIQANNIKVSSQHNKVKKHEWYFELIPENAGVRIMNEEKRYLYVTKEFLEGDNEKHLVAVWQGQGIPPGSVWSVTQC